MDDGYVPLNVELSVTQQWKQGPSPIGRRGLATSPLLGLPMATLDGCSLDAQGKIRPGGNCWHTWGSTDGPETSECEPAKVDCVWRVRTPPDVGMRAGPRQPSDSQEGAWGTWCTKNQHLHA